MGQGELLAQTCWPQMTCWKQLHPPKEEQKAPWGFPESNLSDVVPSSSNPTRNQKRNYWKNPKDANCKRVAFDDEKIITEDASIKRNSSYRLLLLKFAILAVTQN